MTLRYVGSRTGSIPNQGLDEVNREFLQLPIASSKIT
jgi:hypothetical protein